MVIQCPPFRSRIWCDAGTKTQSPPEMETGSPESGSPPASRNSDLPSMRHFSWCSSGKSWSYLKKKPKRNRS